MWLTQDPSGFVGGTNLYAYVEGNPINLQDPLGLFAARDQIALHRAVDIDPECGTNSAGACTFSQALVICSCKCTESGWKANPELRLYGNMYVYSGPFPYKGRRPIDRSVHDAVSAIAHEYEVHIDPAIDAVTPLINKLERGTFGSEGECRDECRKTSSAVYALFGQTLSITQQGENKR